MSKKPTPEAYAELQAAFDHFNVELFEGKLPHCIITLQHGSKRTYGYFSATRFAHRHEERNTDEIALNPYHFRDEDEQGVLQTLAHEMCHAWQQHFGSPPRKCYHNVEWAEKMQAIGLMPSSTGEPGGKTTGQHMADYAMSDGAFARACASLRAGGFKLSWYDRQAELDAQAAAAAEESAGEEGEADGAAEEPKSGKRVKFTCTGDCGANAWGKSSLAIKCVTCDKPFAAAD